MTGEGDYPPGAKYDKDAPYNEDIQETEVKVLVSMTYSKSITVKVQKGYDYPDLYNAALEATLNDTKRLANNGWNEDEFEIIEE